MDTINDVYTRSLVFHVTHHQGIPTHLTLWTRVTENGIEKRQEEHRVPVERLEDLAEILVSELDAFATASGDNGTRSLF